MILSDRTLREYLASGKIMITPPVLERDIRPLGIRIHLSDRLLTFEPGQRVDFRSTSGLMTNEHNLSAAPYPFAPGSFALGSTVEKIQVDRTLCCLIDGRSTLARLGLTIHSTSMVFDNIHDEARTITLELANTGPLNIVLSASIPIGMIVFSTLSAAIEQSSQEQYRGQSSVGPPELGFRIGGDNKWE